ncbi:hypothetical protein ACVW0I_005905 [Bradyrhizobium sp. LM6.11]
MSSSSAITGTGLKKCMPMKRSGRSVAAASFVIEIEEVLVASSVRGDSVAQRSFRILTLSSSFSVAASMTRSQSTSFARSVVPVMRLSVASRSPADIFSFLTSRSRLPPTVEIPRFTAASEISTITTESPAAAQICAMPFPMVPAPIIPTVWIIASNPSSLRTCHTGTAPLFLNQGLAPPPGGCDLILPFLKASNAGIKSPFGRETA